MGYHTAMTSTFLSWNNEQSARESLDSINEELSCPYTDSTGYKMDAWDIIAKLRNENRWGFFSPEARVREFGKTKPDLIDLIEPGHAETVERPENFQAMGRESLQSELPSRRKG